MGRVQGQADPPLDDVGRRQAQALAARLQTENIAYVYSSPLQRARATADLIAQLRRCRVIPDDRLMERHFGEWTGLTGSEVDERLAQMPAGFSWPTDGAPGGENQAQLVARAQSFFDEIVQGQPRAGVAVISHGGLLSAYLRHLLGIPLERRVHFGWKNTAVTCVKLEAGQIYLWRLGDDRHLAGELDA